MNTAKVTKCNEVNFTLNRGTTWEWQVNLAQVNKVPKDLTGYLARMEIRSESGTLLYRLNSIPVTGEGLIAITPLEGKLLLSIPPSHSLNFAEGCYFYDLMLTSPSLQVFPVLEGTITVTRTVTQP
jgi:hypothetical protein